MEKEEEEQQEEEEGNLDYFILNLKST